MTGGSFASSSAYTGAPAMSLNKRLQHCHERPSWASYLPPDLQNSLQQCIESSKPVAEHNTVQTKGIEAVDTDVDESHKDFLGICLSPHSSLPSVQDRSTCSIPLLSLAGRVWSLARDPRGCREVQNALDAASREEMRNAIVQELENHVWEAMRCPHANYVLQKAISLLRPDSLQFFVDEIEQKGPRAINQAAKHKYGCRIIQRLLERCRQCQVHKLTEGLLSDVASTARHPYGNYVLQHLLEYGTDEHKSELIANLQQHASAVGADVYGCAVVSKVFLVGTPSEQVALAKTLAAIPGMVSKMARTRHGHSAAGRLVQALDGIEHEKALVEMRAVAQPWRMSKHSKTAPFAAVSSR